MRVSVTIPAVGHHGRRTRLDGLDAARGLAVVSMLVAHLSPVGGPATLTEYLTAPLFAVIIGTSMGIHLRDRSPHPDRFLGDNLQRGLILILLGILLQRLYDQVIIVLPHLGVLVIVLAPLALLLRRMPVLTVGLAVGLAVVAPVVVDRARLAANENIATWPGWLDDLMGWVATGDAYRLATLLPIALGGLALAAVLHQVTHLPQAWVVAGALFATSLAAYRLGAGTASGSAAYSGTTAEVIGATLLATGSVVASFIMLALAERFSLRRVLEPVLATGRLALTAYTVQILWLALLSVLRDGAPDDAWWILGSSLVVVVGACWALDRWWGTGPLEWLVHRLRPRRVPDTTPRHAATR
jgi:uncharacterized membrane protein YeiB